MAAAPPAHNRALTAVVAPIVASAGLDLEAVTVRSAGRRRVVRIVVDEPGGLSLDRVAGISRDISAALDATNVLGDTPYVLEVTSPGVSRPLTLPRHWANAQGRLVAIRTRDGREFTGRIASSDEAAVTLTEVNPEQAGAGPLPLSDIARAIVQVEFSRIAEVDLGDDDPGEHAEDDETADSGQDEAAANEVGDPFEEYGDEGPDDGFEGDDPDGLGAVSGTDNTGAGSSAGQE